MERRAGGREGQPDGQRSVANSSWHLGCVVIRLWAIQCLMEALNQTVCGTLVCQQITLCQVVIFSATAEEP